MAVYVTGLLVMPPPVAVAVKVFVPGVPSSVHDVTVAVPSEAVAIAVVGTTTPPPNTTANVTSTPATGFPN